MLARYETIVTDAPHPKMPGKEFMEEVDAEFA